MELPKLPIANTIRDQVYQLLKDEICDGRYEPGYWLQEKELAQRLKVSRSPVREALRQLSRDGLVRDIPNKGVFVREFTIRDIEDVFDLRIMMESFALLHLRRELLREEKERLLELLGHSGDEGILLEVEGHPDTDGSGLLLPGTGRKEHQGQSRQTVYRWAFGSFHGLSSYLVMGNSSF